MVCAAHRCNGRVPSAGVRSDGDCSGQLVGRVICFECYRARLDRPEPLPVFVIPFPRLLSGRELAHRRRMISHLAASDAQEASTPA